MAGSTTGAMRQRSASGRTSSDGSGQAGVRALLSTNGTRGKASFPKGIGSACTTSGANMVIAPPSHPRLRAAVRHDRSGSGRAAGMLLSHPAVQAGQ